MLILVALYGCGSGGSSRDPVVMLSPEEQIAFDDAKNCLDMEATEPRVLYLPPVECAPGEEACCAFDPECGYPVPVGISQYCLADNTVTVAMPQRGTRCHDLLYGAYRRGWPGQALHTEMANAVAYQNGVYIDQYNQPCGR